MSVQEIEDAITKLTQRERQLLLRWLDDYQEKSWDNEIATDIQSGKLKTYINQAEKDYKEGNYREI